MKSSGRKALQPRNIFIAPAAAAADLLKPKARELLPKEKLQSVDASLAEELSAFKKKLNRLREDRDGTEKLLKERDGAMDLHMNHLLQRGDIQKTLEIQVDRLFRLKELHAYSSKISPIRSLRAKEQEMSKRSITTMDPALLSLTAFDLDISGTPMAEESSLERPNLGSNLLHSLSVL